MWVIVGQLGLFMGLLEVGSGPVTGVSANFLEPISHAGAWGGAWFCLNLVCHVMLTSMGGLPLSEWRNSGWQGIDRRRGEGSG